MKSVLFPLLIFCLLSSCHDGPPDKIEEWKQYFNYKQDTTYLFYDYNLGYEISLEVFTNDFDKNTNGPLQVAPVSHEIKLESTFQDSIGNHYAVLFIDKKFIRPLLHNTKINFGLGFGEFGVDGKPDSLFIANNPNNNEEMLFSMNKDDTLYIEDPSIKEIVKNSKAQIFANIESGIQWVTNHEGDTILRRVF